MSEANERLFLFRAAPWKSAAKQSLCGNLLTLSLSGGPMEVRESRLCLASNLLKLDSVSWKSAINHTSSPGFI